MPTELKICPYVSKCRIYANGDCSKLRKFHECGDYDDFVAEATGVDFNDLSVYILQQLNLAEEKGVLELETEKQNVSKGCPYNFGCYHVFKKPCNEYSAKNLCDQMCEECSFYLPEFGLHCETSAYVKCQLYHNLNVLKEAYGEQGIYTTQDLKEEFGEDMYDRLGGYIRCAFLEPEDM